MLENAFSCMWVRVDEASNVTFLRSEQSLNASAEISGTTDPIKILPVLSTAEQPILIILTLLPPKKFIFTLLGYDVEFNSSWFLSI